MWCGRDKNGNEKRSDIFKKVQLHTRITDNEKIARLAQLKSIQTNIRTRLQNVYKDDEWMVCECIWKRCVQTMHSANFFLSLHLSHTHSIYLSQFVHFLFFMLVGSCRWPFYLITRKTRKMFKLFVGGKTRKRENKKQNFINIFHRSKTL